MRLNDEIINCVAFLCGTSRKPVATAFFVSIPYNLAPLPVMGHTYLVTAKHCVEGSRPGDLYVRLNIRNGQFEYIKLDSEWIFPQDTSVDLAIMPFKISAFEFEYQTLPFSMLATDAKIKEHSIGIGEEVAITGLFCERAGRKRNIPIVRFGNIAAMPIEKLEDIKTKKEFHGYLIEARSIGGLSGSPVIAFLGPSRIANNAVHMRHYYFFLLGVIRGHWHRPAIVPHRKRNRSVLEDDLGELNFGIAVVTPATELESLLMDDRLCSKRRKEEEAMAKEIAKALTND
jgi:hypothetical protein